jgi:hypothetical protein
MGPPQITRQDWPLILRENWWLIGLASVLLAASLWMTFG